MKHIFETLKKHVGCQKATNLLKQQEGIAAVEFALIAPLLILLFLGTVETSFAVSVDRKLSRTASAIADLVTQTKDPNTNDIKGFMTISNKIMAPYDMVPCIVITRIYVKNGNATVEESHDNSTGVTPKPTSTCSNSGNPNDVARRARSVGSSYPVPAPLMLDDTRLIAAEVEADHSPIVGFFGFANGDLTKDTSAITLSDQILLRPRISN